jgi:prolipoprotein diacylglyceryl transferase
MIGSARGAVLAYLPSPTQSVIHLGPLPIRAYALCIVAGIGLALVMANRRWRARGGTDGELSDIYVWAIVFGIIGGRLYHVISDPELYFKHGEHPLNALKIWDGGLGIWGAVALGGAGAWIGCRRKGIRLAVFADTVIPGVVAAQGIGRWGNWFNNELYGGPTNLPWGLQVHCLDIITGHAVTNGSADGGQICQGSSTVDGLFQPTFLYESIWDLSLALILIWISRRWRLRSGQLFAIYVMGYTAGRGWIEALRDDHANHILGLRLNDWTSLIVFLAGAALFLRRHYSQPDPPSPGSDPASGTEPDDAPHPTTIGTT